MHIFNLKNLMQLSGLNYQMIFLWNKKYKIFGEEKIDENTVFSESDFKKLIFVSFLIESNKKLLVKKLCSMSVSELQVLTELELQIFLEKTKDYTPIIRLMSCACFSYDEKLFDSILNICFKKIGIENCSINILFPFINKLLEISEIYSIEESVKSFMRNLTQNHLHYYLIVSSNEAEYKSDRNWLLFLPEKETMEIGLLFGQLFLKVNGERAFFLGDDQPISTIEECLENRNISHVVTYISGEYDKKMLLRYLEKINEVSKEIVIIIATLKKITKTSLATDIPFINVNNLKEFKYYLDQVIKKEN